LCDYSRMTQTARQLERKQKKGDSVLKQHRLRYGLQVQAVAGVCEIDQSYLSLLENGKRKPSIAVARKLAKFYEVPIERIFP
jgi:transcriptional regulator with XRE-family HTH domain